MILQSLVAYYNRMVADSDSDIAPEGWDWVEIPFILIINLAGEIVQIQDTREGEAKKEHGKKFLVPIGIKKTSGIASNLLWDNASYVLGIGKGNEIDSVLATQISEELKLLSGTGNLTTDSSTTETICNMIQALNEFSETERYEQNVMDLVRIDDIFKWINDLLTNKEFVVAFHELKDLHSLYDDLQVLSEKFKALKRVMTEHLAFIQKIETILYPSPKREACIKCLQSLTPSIIHKYPYYDELNVISPPRVSIRFENDTWLYCQDPEVKTIIDVPDVASTEELKICLVSGEYDSIARLHNSIKGVVGAQSSGASIVAFQLDSSKSFGKIQGENAPVSESAMFAYTTALNHLLRKDSAQKIQIGDATTVFWSENKTPFETIFSTLFSEPPKDNQKTNSNLVEDLFNAPKTGEFYKIYDGTQKFFVLGLSPNAARISIRFWLVGTIESFAEHIRQHFIDLEIIKSEWEPKYFSIKQLLRSLSAQGEDKNISPNLAGVFFRSILEGNEYPLSLLMACVNRVKADHEHRVTAARASIIKAVVNRKMRMNRSASRSEKELNMGLDMDQPSVGYQLGRLMAVLGKIQEEANPGLNATITDRYYGAACSAPVTVFGTLMRLMRHHLAKIENQAKRIWFEQLLGEITGHIAEFPAHLGLEEQGRFAVGYYHQRQAFYTKKED
jgi:CRISPR-associated protein Csd1